MKKFILVRGKSSVYPDVENFLLKFDYFPELPKNIFIEGVELFLKREFHLTLLGNENGKLLGDYLVKDLKYSKKQVEEFYFNLEKQFRSILENSEINFKEEYHFLRKEYNRGKKEIRYSLVQILETDLIGKFYRLFGDKKIFLKSNLPVPHITLYKQKENLGIGINNKEDLKKYSLKKFNKL